MSQLALLAIEPTVSMVAESNEFYTPEVIRRALPPIDIDPCASPWSRIPAARQIVGLHGQDGLSEAWGPVRRPRGAISVLSTATAFVNPPYGRSTSGQSLRALWLAKCRVEWERRHCDPVIALVPVSTAESYWTGNVWGSALLVGYIHGRIRFEGPSGARTDDTASFSSAFVVWASSVRLSAVQHLLQHTVGWVHWTSAQAVRPEVLR